MWRLVCRRERRIWYDNISNRTRVSPGNAPRSNTRMIEWARKSSIHFGAARTHPLRDLRHHYHALVYYLSRRTGDKGPSR